MIPIVHPTGAGGLEPCAVRGPSCKGYTAFWTALPNRQAKDQVACCKACSEACRTEEVPSKDEWFRWVARRPLVAGFSIAQYAARNEFGDVTDLTHLWMVLTGGTSKTKVWAVIAKEGGFELGKIKWFGRWRCYAFFPTDSIFEPKCLREIADFIEGKTREHRQKKARPAA